MTTNAHIPVGVQIWMSLHRARDTILRARQDELREVGISVTQSALLHVLKEMQGPATPARLSRWLFREPNTVFAAVKHMEKQGFVTTVRDMGRKNMVRVAITEKGEEVYRRSVEKMDIVKKIMSVLSEEESATMLVCLEKLRSKGLEELQEITARRKFGSR